LQFFLLNFINEVALPSSAEPYFEAAKEAKNSGSVQRQGLILAHEGLAAVLKIAP
jgi:hypothetical protein